MKKVSFWVMVCLLLITASCKKNDSRMLSTIPADTPYVVVLNTEQIGAKLIKDPKALANIKGIDKKVGEVFEKAAKIIDEKEPMAVFEYNNTPVVSVIIKSEDDFKQFAQEMEIGTLSNHSGVWVSNRGDVFMRDNQVWFTSGSTTFTDQSVRMLENLKEGKSLADQDEASELLSKDVDMCGLVGVDKTLSSMGGNKQMSMGTSLLFDNMEYVYFETKFDKSAINFTITPLDKNYKAAKCALPSAKIDMNTLKGYTGQGNLFMAMAIDPEFLKGIVSQYGSLMGPYKGMFDILVNINGTIVASANTETDDFGMMLNFNSPENAARGAEYVEDFMPIDRATASIDGTKLYVHTEQQQGQPISSVADKFTGCEFAFSWKLPQQLNYPVKDIIVTGKREGNTLIFKGSLSTEPGANSLVRLLEATSKQNIGKFN